MTWHLRISYVGVPVSCCPIHKFWAFCVWVFKAVFLLNHINSMRCGFRNMKRSELCAGFLLCHRCKSVPLQTWVFNLSVAFGFKGHVCFLDCSRRGQTVYLDTYFRRKKNMLWFKWVLADITCVSVFPRATAANSQTRLFSMHTAEPCSGQYSSHSSFVPKIIFYHQALFELAGSSHSPRARSLLVSTFPLIRSLH